MLRIEPHQVAVVEAFEEAGVSGKICPAPLGNFTYEKRLSDGTFRSVNCIVFLLAVSEEAATWPEIRARARQWFSLEDAASAVDEASFKTIIAGFYKKILGMLPSTYIYAKG